MSVEEMDNLKVDVNPKAKYNYGDKYKGRYKDTHHKIYLRKREAMTQDEKEKMKLYKRNYYLQNIGLFCKQEWKFEKATKIPLRIRLGSLQQCNWLEGKKYSAP